MDLFGVQLTVLLYLFLGNILFGCLPLILGKIIEKFSCIEEVWYRKIKWATFLLYTGAGVFISNSFVILLPQANQQIQSTANHSHHGAGHSLKHNDSSEHGSGHHHESFPIPEFIVLCGFFLAYVLQELVCFTLSKCNRIPKETSNMRVSFCSCAKRHTECSRTFKDARPDQTLFGLEKKLLESGNIANSTAAAANIPPEVEVNAQSELLRSSILAQAMPNYGTVTNVTEPAIDNPLPVLTSPVLLAEERRAIIAQHTEAKNQNKFLTSSILIVIALTLQYIFHGVELGVHTESLNQWSYLLVACLQNFILTFSASSYIAVGNMKCGCVLLLILLLSSVSPIGMIVAIIYKEAVTAIPCVATGVVLANACGVLLYITFYEVLRQKNFGSVVGVIKFLAITFGASITILLQYANIILSNKK